MSNESDAPDNETVILVHGLGAKAITMALLRMRLSRRGFKALSFSYRSLTGSIERHGTALWNHLTELNHESKIHIVAHSMGCIVARTALTRERFANLGRAVFLAPPNRGTPVARYGAKLVGEVCKPIAELSDAQHSFVNSLSDNKMLDVGVIAAKYDVLVPTASTHLDHETDHAVLSATHNSLLFSKRATDLTVAFIKTGQFEQPSEA